MGKKKAQIWQCKECKGTSFSIKQDSWIECLECEAEFSLVSIFEIEKMNVPKLIDIPSNYS